MPNMTKRILSGTAVRVPQEEIPRPRSRSQRSRSQSRRRQVVKPSRVDPQEAERQFKLEEALNTQMEMQKKLHEQLAVGFGAPL
jgi:MYB-CC type transfactor, LHEQLE motif